MPPVNLHERVRDILAHGAPLPVGADSPILHFELTTDDIERTLEYVERKLDVDTSLPRIAERHLSRLRQMALVSLIESLKRFFKEVAAECIDILAPLTADDRFDAFRVSGSALAGHFGTGTFGRALCEAGTWLECKAINERFRDLLTDPSPTPPPLPTFQLFPLQPPAEREHYDTLQLIWQLRHTVVHNVGVVTQSDAVKLRVLSRRPVDPLRAIVPTRRDLLYLTRYLNETADRCNQRIADRLAQVLTRIHSEDPSLLDPTARAEHVAAQFRCDVTVAGITATVPR
jgi:hypothetical protein